MKHVLAALGAVAALACVALAVPAADAKTTAQPVPSHRLKAHKRVVKTSPHDSGSTSIVVPPPLPEPQPDSSTSDDCHLTGNNCTSEEACQVWLENCDQVDQPAMSLPPGAPPPDGSSSS
jgi:hypothetical protein